VYEGRPSWSSDGSSKGPMGQLSNAKKRSINLALSHRGLSALAKIGLAEKVLKDSVPMHGRMIHPPGESDPGKTVFQPYDHKAGNHIYSISREELNQALLDEMAAMPNVSVQYGHKFETMDRDSMVCHFAADHNDAAAEPSTRVRVRAKFCLGADGAFSKVRIA
jgi:kynurenine 3-monooxygenase